MYIVYRPFRFVFMVCMYGVLLLKVLVIVMHKVPCRLLNVRYKKVSDMYFDELPW